MARITKDIAESLLGAVPPDKAFYSRDGERFKSMSELESALKKMSDDTFRYHLNETKNDFSIWVKEVIGDEKLARDILKSQNRANALKSVTARVAWLKRRISAV